MFGLRKRIKTLERKLGISYVPEDDYSYYEENKNGTLADIEERLSKLEESNPSKK